MIDYLSQLYLPGALALWSALFFALAALWGYVRALEGDVASLLFARRSYRFFALSLVLSAFVLAVLLLRRDFRIEYVYQYTGLELPWSYQLSAFWAGQKGSFLIWLVWCALLGLLLYRTAGREEPAVMGVYTLTQLGLLFILVRESPFVMLRETPTDGQGLNPLLQDDWMVIHPPIMFVGYAAAAIPFSFALAAMWRRRYDGWAARAFPWALGGFLVLGTAILLGGYWAYKTLGWGGYWGWDPVENASLIPWLLGTVLIHGLYLERTRQRFRRANLVLACLVYLSVLYGTFLTRSGVLADFSVHSFVDLGISGWLVALMAFFAGSSLWLLVTRLKEVPTERNEDPLLSRGSFMVLSTIAVGISALVITIGTSAPLLTWFMDNPGQVGPEFYNRVNLPLALLVAFLLSLIPFLSWRGAPLRQIGRAIVPTAVVAAGVTAAAAGLGVLDPFHLLFVFLASLALATNLQKTVSLARNRGWASMGGYLAHVGVGIILLGFLASSAYDQSAKVTLVQGEPRQIGELTLTFHRFLPREGKVRERLEVEVAREDGTSYLAHPQMFLNDRTRQVMVHPDIESFLLRDLYISPIQFDPGQPAGGGQQLRLAKGEAAEVAPGVRLTFRDFDLNVEGNAMEQMASGGAVAIGADLLVERDGESTELTPVYRFNPSGQVMARPALLPGGGEVRVAAIDASSGGVELWVAGLDTAQAGVPPSVSVDVTRKPLIGMVWGGLWVILAGGGLAALRRLRQARRLEGSPVVEPAPSEPKDEATVPAEQPA